MGRKIMYVCFLAASVMFLWTWEMAGEAGFFLNMISPVVYGKGHSVKVSTVMERIGDHVMGWISPTWLFEKELWSFSYPIDREIYPSEEERYAAKEERVYEPVVAPVASGQGMVYTAEMLRDESYFINQFYVVDGSTYVDGLLDAEVFMNMDLRLDMSEDGPKILIYHTHSQEGFLDSREGVWQDTVVGLGDRLKSELEERYHIPVFHLTDTFDVIDGVSDRSAAYTYAEERVREILAEYPTIEVVIDLHRDGVDESTHLVTTINGKDTAKLMLLNGLCRTTVGGPISYLQNDYLTENLAFSFQIQRKAAEYYPDLMRRIYLRSYQYNLHMMPKSLLVECGAQNNTVEEAQNAMPYLADMLYLVLTEKIYDK